MENKILVKESASNLRAAARQMLKGKWAIAVLGTLAYSVALNLPSYIIKMVLGTDSSIGVLLDFVYIVAVGGAFVVGYSSFILSIQRGKDARAAEIFSGFEQFGRAFCIYILMQLLVLLWSIPSGIFGAISIVSITGGMTLGSPAAIGAGILAFIAAIVALVLPIRAELSYSQCFFLAIDHPQMRAIDTIMTSKNLMNGNKWKLFCVNFSFIGWALLCFAPLFITLIIFAMSLSSVGSTGNFGFNMMALGLSLGAMFLIGGLSLLGYLWLMPYMTVTEAGFYEILTERLTINQSNLISETSPLESTLNQQQAIDKVIPENEVEENNITHEKQEEETILEVEMESNDLEKNKDDK